MRKREQQLFKPFIPTDVRILLLGGFTAVAKDDYDWYYGSNRSQFWKIFEKVYGIKITTTRQKKDLFRRLGIAIADTILACERSLGNSSDANLENIEYNIHGISEILKNNSIKSILFTSRFAEKIYLKNHKHLIFMYPMIKMYTLPSPSPRYARMSFDEKVIVYRKMLPSLEAI